MLMDPPVVVTGLPRSGTSLVMRMLEAAGIPPLTDGVRVPDEDNPGGYFETEEARLPGAAGLLLARASGRCVKITIPQINRVPAETVARVIHVKRDPGEVIVSQAKMLARRGRQPAASAEVLRPAFQRLLMETEAFLAAARGLEVLTLEYRELVEKPVESAVALAAFLLKPSAAEAMAGCVDPTLYRNRV